MTKGQQIKRKDGKPIFGEQMVGKIDSEPIKMPWGETHIFVVTKHPAVGYCNCMQIDVELLELVEGE